MQSSRIKQILRANEPTSENESYHALQETTMEDRNVSRSILSESSDESLLFVKDSDHTKWQEYTSRPTLVPKLHPREASQKIAPTSSATRPDWWKHSMSVSSRSLLDNRAPDPIEAKHMSLT